MKGFSPRPETDVNSQQPAAVPGSHYHKTKVQGEKRGNFQSFSRQREREREGIYTGRLTSHLALAGGKLVIRSRGRSDKAEGKLSLSLWMSRRVSFTGPEIQAPSERGLDLSRNLNRVGILYPAPPGSVSVPSASNSLPILLLFCRHSSTSEN